MIIEDTEKMIIAASQASTTPDTAGLITQGSAAESILKADSISQVVKDSIAKLDITDVKDVITGENTLIKDALSGLLDLTVAFIPKLIGCILVLWVGFKLIKLLKKAISKVLDRRDAESSLKGFLTSLVDVLLTIMLIIRAKFQHFFRQ